VKFRRHWQDVDSERVAWTLQKGREFRKISIFQVRKFYLLDWGIISSLKIFWKERFLWNSPNLLLERVFFQILDHIKQLFDSFNWWFGKNREILFDDFVFLPFIKTSFSAHQKEVVIIRMCTSVKCPSYPVHMFSHSSEDWTTFPHWELYDIHRSYCENTLAKVLDLCTKNVNLSAECNALLEFMKWFSGAPQVKNRLPEESAKEQIPILFSNIEIKLQYTFKNVTETIEKFSCKIYFILVRLDKKLNTF